MSLRATVVCCVLFVTVAAAAPYVLSVKWTDASPEGIATLRSSVAAVALTGVAGVRVLQAPGTHPVALFNIVHANGTVDGAAQAALVGVWVRLPAAGSSVLVADFGAADLSQYSGAATDAPRAIPTDYVSIGIAVAALLLVVAATVCCTVVVSRRCRGALEPRSARRGARVARADRECTAVAMGDGGIPDDFEPVGPSLSDAAVIMGVPDAVVAQLRAAGCESLQAAATLTPAALAGVDCDDGARRALHHLVSSAQVSSAGNNVM
jgi:hypothetical protein